MPERGCGAASGPYTAVMRQTQQPRRDVAEAAEALRRADDALVARRELLQRTEWKFPVPVARLAQLIDDLGATHDAVDSRGSAVAEYRTWYFDTPELTCFHDHRRGRPRRAKVRFRDYLERRLTRLEVKIRSPRGTAKHVLERPFQRRALEPEELDFLGERLPRPLDRLVPSLAVAFQRVTLVGRIRAERITVDHQLVAHRAVDGHWCQADRSSFPGLGVVEVKATSRAEAWPTLRWMADRGLRPWPISKYCLGLSTTGSGLRDHRLRPSMRHAVRLGGG